MRLYTTADCSGSPAATGTAAAFASPGLQVTVAPDSTTTFRAPATDAAGNPSACSTSSLTYVNDSTAPGAGRADERSPRPRRTPSTTPVVKGTAEAGSTVKLYTTATCTGTPAATGTAAAFASPGLTATVVLGSTTTFKATATDAAGNTSACSTSSLTYTSDLLDGGFEAATGNPADSPFWIEADSLAGVPAVHRGRPARPEAASPLRARATRGPGSAGSPTPGHTGSLTQALTIPVGTVALTYWYKNSHGHRAVRRPAAGPGRRHDREDPHRGPRGGDGYSQQFADLSPFADGGTHTLSFSYTNGGRRASTTCWWTTSA